MDRQNQQPTAAGGGYYNSTEETPSSILWDLDSSSLIVPPLVPTYFHPTTEFGIRPQTSDTMRREISEESGYQTAFDEGSSSWASDWPTNQTEYHHQGWSSSEDFFAQDSQPTSDEMGWFQQSWGFPDVFPSTATPTNQSENNIHSNQTTSYSIAGRSESTSSDETLNDVSVPSGKTFESR